MCLPGNAELKFKEERKMPDGRRKRRFSANKAKRHWYAMHRTIRFAKRMWAMPPEAQARNVG